MVSLLTQELTNVNNSVWYGGQSSCVETLLLLSLVWWCGKWAEIARLPVFGKFWKCLGIPPPAQMWESSFPKQSDILNSRHAAALRGTEMFCFTHRCLYSFYCQLLSISKIQYSTNTSSCSHFNTYTPTHTTHRDISIYCMCVCMCPCFCRPTFMPLPSKIKRTKFDLNLKFKPNTNHKKASWNHLLIPKI